MGEKKEKLIEQLNISKSNLHNFIYPDYPDLQIYSKEYYRNIFLNFFSNTEKVFSFTYGDFNKIKKINDTFGNIAGDRALEIGHRLIRESFPSKSYISRIGGDETTIISLGLNKDETSPYIDILNKKLEDFSQNLKDISISIDKYNTDDNSNMSYLDVSLINLQKIYNIFGEEAFNKTLNYIQQILSSFLPQNTTITKTDPLHFRIITDTNLDEKELMSYQNRLNKQLSDLISPLSISITISVSDSTIADIRELEHITDKDVAEKKSLRVINELNNSEYDSWEILNKFINTSIENHLSDIRPSDKFIYDIEHYKRSIFFMLDTFIESLEHKISNDEVNYDSLDSFDLDNIISEDKETLFTENDILANSELVSLVHTFLTSNEVDLKEINEEKLSEMYEFIDTLLEHLTHNKNSGLLNKSYMKHHLSKQICNKKSDLQVVVLSMLDIKSNNTAFGHIATDERILKTTSMLENLYNDRTFNNEAFTFPENSSYFIDYNGGDLLMLLDNNQRTTQKELDEIIKKVNDSHDSYDPDSPLLVTGIISEYIPTNDVNDITQFLKDLKQKCNYKKDALKVENFDNITRRISFEKSIDKPIQYYFKNIPNPTDIEQKRKFISMVFDNLLEHEVNHNSKSKNKNSDIEMV